jgi:hypothetical protein
LSLSFDLHQLTTLYTTCCLLPSPKRWSETGDQSVTSGDLVQRHVVRILRACHRRFSCPRLTSYSQPFPRPPRHRRPLEGIMPRCYMKTTTTASFTASHCRSSQHGRCLQFYCRSTFDGLPNSPHSRSYGFSSSSSSRKQPSPLFCFFCRTHWTFYSGGQTSPAVANYQTRPLPRARRQARDMRPIDYLPIRMSRVTSFRVWIKG